MTTGKWRDIKQTWKCAFMEKTSQWLWLWLSNQFAKPRAGLLVECYPMNSKVSKAGLQKQLSKAAALSCLGRVGQTTSVLSRRREDVGRNSQVQAEAEVISERVKVFYLKKDNQSRWEKDQRPPCVAMWWQDTEKECEALCHAQLLSNTAIRGLIYCLHTECIAFPLLMDNKPHWGM